VSILQLLFVGPEQKHKRPANLEKSKLEIQYWWSGVNV
ncbi:uncharacterized protein METZ01_LOCUS340845, partial [marine metagenome]